MEEKANIICLAEDYVVKHTGTKTYVYNMYYEGKLWKLMTVALVGLLMPEPDSYFLPLCVELSKTQGNIVIDKQLEVHGTAEYRYFIARHQYDKWKKVYDVVMSVLLIVATAVNVLCMDIFLRTGYSVVAGICELVVLALTIGAFFSLGMKNKKRKRYEIVEIEF